MALKAALLLLAAVLPSSSASACQGSSCKVEAPQDEVSLMQMKMEAVTGGDPVDLDNGKNALAAEVEAGKQELREYVEELKENESSDQEEELGGCPSGFDMSALGNDNVANFMNQCLDNVANNAGMSKKAMAQMKDCVGGTEGNPYSNGNVVTGITQSGGMFNMQMKTAKKGGVCNAKPFQVKCDSNNKIKPGCAGVNLYRVFNSGGNWFSTYWVAENPTQFGGANNTAKRQSFRTKLAICEDWSKMDEIAVAKLNDRACGKFIWIGNGEPVTNCPKETEDYGYSTTLQIVMCEYPQSKYMDKVRTTPFPK